MLIHYPDLEGYLNYPNLAAMEGYLNYPNLAASSHELAAKGTWLK